MFEPNHIEEKYFLTVIASFFSMNSHHATNRQTRLMLDQVKYFVEMQHHKLGQCVNEDGK